MVGVVGDLGTEVLVDRTWYGALLYEGPRQPSKFRTEHGRRK